MPGKTYGLDDFVGGKLAQRWSSRRDRLTDFFKAVGLTGDVWSQALYVRTLPTDDVNKTLDDIQGSIDPHERWDFLVANDGTKRAVLCFPVSKRARSPVNGSSNAMPLYAEVHSRLVCWWLTNAWRSQQLASATYTLGDTLQVIPAAACARSLLETAASLLDETKRLRETWTAVKSDCAVGGPSLQHYKDLSLDLWKAQWGSKFSKDKATPSSGGYGWIERTNILTLVSKLSKHSESPVQEDYEWLCNVVHPSIGGMLSFSGPFLQHRSGATALQSVAPFPLSIRSGSSPDEHHQLRIVEEVIMRSAVFAIDVLATALDTALRLVDDVALTTHAPDFATFPYWRNIRAGGRNSQCPCRSGRKVKDCRHDWDTPPALLGEQFDLTE